MKHIVILLVLLFPTGLFAQQWSIGYWTPWGNPAVPISAIQWDALTHVVQWGALVKPDGTLDLTSQQVSANASAIIATAHAANVKVLLGIGQAYWLGQTTNFQQAITNRESALIANIMNLVNTYGYDGVDIDWEPFDSSSNGTAMTRFIADLRAQLGNRLLTAAAIITNYNFWGSVASNLDRVNIMTYDMSGMWDPYSWHNSALMGEGNPIQVWTVNLAVQRYLNGGVPASKLGIGIPFYGWQWIGGGITGPKQVWSQTPSLSQVGYNEFFSQINTQNYRWDSTAQVPYLTNNSGTPSFLSYDNAQSITAKINYVKDHNLGGWIIWALDHDYFPNGNPQHPLMMAIRDAMGVTPLLSPTNLRVVKVN